MSKHKRHNVDIKKEDVPVQKDNTKPDLSSLSSLLNNVDMSQLTEMMSNLGINPGENVNAAGADVSAPRGDRRVEVLTAIRPMLDAEKTQILDTIMQLYGISRVLKKK